MYFVLCIMYKMQNMKNLEPENNFAGEESWEKIASILVKGDGKAMSLNSEKSDEYNEAVKASWRKAIVLRVLAPKKTKFYVGLATRKKMKYMPLPMETDLKFAVRIGPRDFQVFVLPEDIEDKILLEIVEYAEVEDEKYKDLILI